jgi:hypothetical protein
MERNTAQSVSSHAEFKEITKSLDTLFEAVASERDEIQALQKALQTQSKR